MNTHINKANQTTLQRALSLALCVAPQLGWAQSDAAKPSFIIPNAEIEEIDAAEELAPAADAVSDTDFIHAENEDQPETWARIEAVSPEMASNVDVEVLAFSGDKNETNDNSEETELKVIVNQDGQTKSYKWKIDDLHDDKTIRRFIDASAADAKNSYDVDVETDHDFTFKLKDASFPSLEGGTWLGVIAAEISSDVANQLPIRDGAGLIIRGLIDNAPAADSGLMESDVLYMINDQILFTVPQLVKLIQSYEPGDTIKVAAYRKGKEHDFDVKLGERSSQPTELVFERLAPAQSTAEPSLEQYEADDVMVRRLHRGPVTIVESNGKVKVLKPDDTRLKKDIEQSIRKALQDIEVDTQILDKILEVLDSEFEIDR